MIASRSFSNFKPTIDSTSSQLPGAIESAFLAIEGDVDALAGLIPPPVTVPVDPRKIALNKWYGALQTGASVAVTGYPIVPVFDGKNIWSFGSGLSGTAKVDPSAGEVLVEYGPIVTNDYCRVVYDGKYFWSVITGSGEVTRMNPLTGASAVKYNSGSSYSCVCFDGKNLWAAGLPNKLDKLTIANGELTLGTQTNLTAGNHFDAVFDGAYIWVLHSSGFDLVRASDGVVVDSNTSLTDPRGAFFDGKYVWITCLNDKSIRSFSRNVEVVTAHVSIDVGFKVYAVTGDGESVWVGEKAVPGGGVGMDGTNVSRWKASDGSFMARYAVPASPVGLCFDGTYVWAACSSGALVKL